MKNTRQGSQSVWEHGESVRDHLFDLINHLRHGTSLVYDWRIPDWVSTHLLEKLLPDEDLKLYTLFHDCGKPNCLELDEQGRSHFPNHADVSAKVFSEIFSNSRVENLIKSDMIVHTMSAADVPEFAKRDEAVSLLLTALAEIHANAEMFGGIESTSFKIKWKHIDKRGRAILKHIV